MEGKIIISSLIILNIILSMVLAINIYNTSLLSEDENKYISKIKELKIEQSSIEQDIKSKSKELSGIKKSIKDKKKIDNGTAKYIIKLNISQSHFTLDLTEHLKDQMNDIDIYVEVSEEFYNKYSVGDTIADDFRVGSMIFKGSFGNWKVKVAEKKIV